MRLWSLATPWIGVGLLLGSGSGCTGSPGQFHLQEQKEVFASLQKVNTKLDMLWVIDSSGSMEAVQSKVRAGVQQFATQYMKPTWDIRVAAITADAFLADPSFWQGPSGQPSYLTLVRPGTANYTQNYFNGLSRNYGGSVVPPRSKHYYDTSSWVTALTFPLFNSFQPTAYAPALITYNSSGTEKFLAAGMRIIDTKPQLGPNWAKLLIGNHDGPQLSMCWDNDEASPQFIYGQTACYHRDDPANSQYHTGINNCVNPGTGETGPSQCINTFANNTVHTGLPIISTLPPSGVPADQAWTDQLIANVRVNLTPSTVGNGGERAFQSVLQFLHDNEADPNLRFFREDSLRVIVFVGDEDDQSQLVDPNQYAYGTGYNYGTGTPGNYTPGQGTKAHVIPENASPPFICKKLYSGANNGYFYPDGDTGRCVDPAWILPVGTFKNNLDTFFRALDGSPSSAKPNYFVAAITTMNSTGLAGAGYNFIAQRYPALVDLVGNGSMTLDVTQSDYSPLLAQVGQSILQAKAEFQLKRAPLSTEEMQVVILHGNGTSTLLTTAQFTVDGSLLIITDLSVISSFEETDNLQVTYEPKTIY